MSGYWLAPLAPIIPPVYRSATLLLAASLAWGCATSSPPAAPRSAPPMGVPENIDEIFPEIQSYLPFPSLLAASELDDGRWFYTGMVKVTMELRQGRLVFLSDQEPLHNSYECYAECPDAYMTIDDQAAFRSQAELYLRPASLAVAEDAYLAIDGARFPIHSTGGCAGLSGRPGLTLTPYLRDGAEIELVGLKEHEDLRFRLPEPFVPFVFVRYHTGAIIPGPTRLDTFTVDAEKKRVILVYRTTFWPEPSIRKVEFRAIVPHDLEKRASGSETIEERDRRNAATVAYLRQGASPDGPGEPCIDAGLRPPMEIYGTSWRR